GFTSPGVADLVAKWGTVGSRSYYLLASGESLFFFWSTDGTTEHFVSRRFAPITADGRMAFAVHLDVDDGAGGHTVTFWTAPRLEGPWEQLGDPASASGVGTTSIHAGTAPLVVGRIDTGRTYKA